MPTKSQKRVAIERSLRQATTTLERVERLAQDLRLHDLESEAALFASVLRQELDQLLEHGYRRQGQLELFWCPQTDPVGS